MDDPVDKGTLCCGEGSNAKTIPRALADVMAMYFGIDDFKTKRVEKTTLQKLYTLLNGESVNYVVVSIDGRIENLVTMTFFDKLAAKYTLSTGVMAEVLFEEYNSRVTKKGCCFICATDDDLQWVFTPFPCDGVTRRVLVYRECGKCTSRRSV